MLRFCIMQFYTMCTGKVNISYKDFLVTLVKNRLGEPLQPGYLREIHSSYERWWGKL